MDPAEHDEPHLPAPTIGPVGFALGIVVVLVGLIVDPLWISTTGAVIAVIFAFVWARESTAELRSGHVPVEPETRPAGGCSQGCGKTTSPTPPQHRHPTAPGSAARIAQ